MQPGSALRVKSPGLIIEDSDENPFLSRPCSGDSQDELTIISDLVEVPVHDEDDAASEHSSSVSDWGYNTDQDISGIIASYHGPEGDVPVAALPVTHGLKRKAPTEPTESPRPLKQPANNSVASMSKAPEEHRTIIPNKSDEPINMVCNHTMAALFAKLPFGVQYEMSRLATSFPNLHFTSFSPEHLRQLADDKTNVAAMTRFPSIARTVLLANDKDTLIDDGGSFTNLYERESNARSPWQDMDKEEEALKGKNILGLMGFEPNGSPSTWYGGKAVFRGTLEKSNGEYRIKLEKPEIGPSTHLGRRFGSKNIFRLKIPRTFLLYGSKTVLDFVKRPILLCGGVFRAFHAKELTVIFIKTNEVIHKGQIDPSRTVEGLSFLDFVRWVNPPDLNSSQGMAKYSSRFGLLLSSSAPGYLLEKGNISFEADIVHSETASNMTDGAGSIGRRVMSLLFRHFGWGDRPSAIQVRVHGSKGLLVDDKIDHEDMTQVYLTPSQIKIKYPVDDMDPARLVVDVLAASRLRPSKKLAVETIINIAENGVPAEVFFTLMETMLETQMSALLDWDGPEASLRLWKAMEELGGVLGARRARENPGAPRLYGYIQRGQPEDDDDDDDNDAGSQYSELAHQSTAWWPDPVSGSPSSLEETVIDLLAAGFHPATCQVLAEKMKQVIIRRIKNQARKYRIQVPMSCGGMIIPDKRGLLEEGEIFFRSPTRNLLGVDGEMTDIIAGDIIITRLPCKLPSDCQKWKAVKHPGLYDLIGVVVLSTKGPRRAADMLAGGDYDGDKAVVIWDPAIVGPFVQQENHFADPPADNFLIKNFQAARNVPVHDFFEKVKGLPIANQIYDLQDHLLACLQGISSVGIYSNLHQNAIQMLGYRHPETIRLAHMFCLILDGTKTGLQVLPEVERQDRHKYDVAPPPWKRTLEAGNLKDTTHNSVPLQRNPELGSFIMDQVSIYAKIEEDRWISRVEEFYAEHTSLQKDLEVIRPYEELLWKSTQPGGEGYKEDLDKIHEVVQRVYKRHREELNPKTSASQPVTPGGPKFSEQPIETRQNTLRSLSREFAQSPDPMAMHMMKDDVQRVKASFAYWYDREQNKGSRKWTRFPWDVAFRELCDIKAKALGLPKTVTSEFYHHMVVKLAR